MGLFDFLKNKQKNVETQPSVQQNNEQKSFNINYKWTRDGNLQVDFYDSIGKFGQFYDTTRLIVSQTPEIIANQCLQDCQVSWYGSNDAVVLGGEYFGESKNSVNYSHVLAQIDTNLLMQDEEYCYTVMKRLLDRKRVMTYLEDGLKENAQLPCGEYIGGIQKQGNEYKKVFSEEVGNAAHYSAKMVNRRAALKQKNEVAKQMEIEAKKRKIQELQGEIDDLSR